MHNPTSQHQFSLFLLPKQNNIIILKIVNLASFFIVSTEAINLMYVVVKRDEEWASLYDVRSLLITPNIYKNPWFR